MEIQMQQNADKVPNVLELSFGKSKHSIHKQLPSIRGENFATTKDKLLAHKGSLFEHMLLTDHSKLLTPSGKYVSLIHNSYIHNFSPSN
jgi:hypothetical protein